MSKTVEWKVDCKEDGGYYLSERESGTAIWYGVRRRGLFGNRNKEQFQASLSNYEQKLGNIGVKVVAEEWPT